MSKRDSFSVSSKSHPTGVVVSYDSPNGSLADPAWEKMIGGDHSAKVSLTVSKAVADAVAELAEQNWVIKAQAAVRPKLPSKDACQTALNGYRYGAKGGSGVVVDAALLKLNKAQCEALEQQGATVLNKPAK